MRKFNTLLVIALSFVGFSAFAEEAEANDSKEVAVESSAAETEADTAEVASEVEVESPSQE